MGCWDIRWGVLSVATDDTGFAPGKTDLLGVLIREVEVRLGPKERLGIVEGSPVNVVHDQILGGSSFLQTSEVK